MPKATNPIIKKVRKRDGETVPFDQLRITRAVNAAIAAVEGMEKPKVASKISDLVLREMEKRFGRKIMPGVEDIQDIVEESLIKRGLTKVAKAYILYRSKRAQAREARKAIPEKVRELASESKKYFRNELAEFIYYRTYSRWADQEGRRETWVETCARYMDFMKENLANRLSAGEYKELHDAILNQEAMPSMRLMWGAGKAVRKTNVSAYNCSYIAPSKLADFAEIMYLSMCGTGVGFSVESQTVQKLPIVKHQTEKAPKTYVIEDSKEGWGDALTLGFKAWYGGGDVKFDYSKIRPAGARLATMGGQSSGPEPLRALLDFARSKIISRQGKRLSNLDVHDIICKIGEVVVMGGVRRCLPQNTLVHTEKGLKPIKNISIGDTVLTGRGRYKKVVAAEHTGRRQLVSLNTQLGIFQSTPEHRWAVLDDLHGNVRWVEASKLTQNDTLVHIPDVIMGERTSLPGYKYSKPKYSTTTKDIRIPNLDEDIAWLIGYFHGDGYVYRKSETCGELMFACSPDMPKTTKRITEIIERFGVNAYIKSGGKHDKAVRVRVKSNQLANYFYQFKQPNTPIRIPDFILEGTLEIRAGYIAGVFDSDGSVKSRNGKKVRPIVASSVYPDWLRQLRAVLASIDISSRVKQNRPARNNWKALYQLTLISMESFSAFADSMLNRSEKWENDGTSMERKKEQCSFVVPRNLLLASDYRKQFESAYYAPSSNVSLSFSKFERERSVATMEEQIFYPTVLRVERQYRYRPIKIYGVEHVGDYDETYDIQVEGDECFVAEGMLVHNSALISLSDLDDDEMRHAKEGQFYLFEPQRQMANNSAVYNKKPSTAEFMEEWLALAKSGTGERGIFNRAGLKRQLPERRWKVFKKHFQTSGTNPCGEIVLRSKQFCNLSEVVCRADDTKETLLRKVRLATILGTYQSSLTYFPYLSKEWKQNCEEERLLGVSLTGQWDCPQVRNAEVLKALNEEAVLVNKKYAKRFGINASTCISCVKPSGTVSQLVDAASGMHPRHAKYYIRRVRISATDPLFHMLRDQKFPYYPEVGQAADKASTYVLEFPVKAPKRAITRNKISASDQLEHWKNVKENYTEHNPSVTVSVGEDEWIDTANWLYKNWEILGGLSFLPRTDHSYSLAPYEEIAEERYNEMVAKMPRIDFSQILLHEKSDATQGAKELACVAGVCEVEEVSAVNTQQA